MEPDCRDAAPEGAEMRAMLWEPLSGGEVQCRLCAHACRLKKGGKGEPKVVREITYCKIQIGETTVLELDKYNLIWKLNGVDRLQKVRSQI